MRQRGAASRLRLMSHGKPAVGVMEPGLAGPTGVTDEQSQDCGGLPAGATALPRPGVAHQATKVHRLGARSIVHLILQIKLQHTLDKDVKRHLHQTAKAKQVDPRHRAARRALWNQLPTPQPCRRPATRLASSGALGTAAAATGVRGTAAARSWLAFAVDSVEDVTACCGAGSCPAPLSAACSRRVATY